MYDASYERMQEDWKKIISFGSRPFGSPQVRACGEFLLNTLREMTPDAYMEEFQADACEVKDWGLEIVSPNPRKVESYLFLGSGGSDGFEGELRYAGKTRIWDMYTWERFSVVDANENIMAYISVRIGGKAVPQMLFFGESWLPHYIVGEEELSFFQNAVNETTIVRGFAYAGKLPQAQGANIIAPFRQSQKKVLLCAHYDSVYSTPGAYDNSAGAAVVLEIARRLKQRTLHTGLEIMLTDGEEYNLAGAYYNCSHRDDVAMVLNIDGVGRDKQLEIWSGPEPMERRIRGYFENSVEDITCMFHCPPPPGSDHAPYYSKGIPVCMLTFNDQGILHSPLDIYEPSKLDNMAVMVRLAMGMLKELGILS